MRFALASLAILFACSGYGESDADDEPSPPASDGGDAGDGGEVGDAASTSDAGADVGATACDPTKPFGQTREVPGINTAENELNLWLSEDEKTAYVTAIRATVAPRYDVYTTSRASASSPFGALVPMGDVNVVDSNTTDPTLTPDGLTIVFASQRPATSDAGADLFTATRPSATTAFTTAVPVVNVNAEGDDQNAFLTVDGLELFWNSPRNGAVEIVRTVRGNGGSFGAVESAGLGPNSSNAVLSRDGLTIFYGVGLEADIDIWTAHRSARGAPFTGAARVVELATPAREVPQWLSPDGCRLYFMSNRPGTGAYDQWVAERPQAAK